MSPIDASLSPNHPVPAISTPSARKLMASPLFTQWTDPVSGVTSFILGKKVAPIQQSFYFVNPSLTLDGRYYWFYCAFPPTGNANQGRSLGVADLRENRIHHYPETGFTDASPLVDTHTGEVYWCTGLEIWKRRPEPEATPEFVNRFPPKLACGRRPWRLATHLTFSADRTALNLDVEIGGEWYVGHAPLDGSEFVLWEKFDRCYNHAQYSPIEPDLQLIAQDGWVDQQTGKATGFDNRLWLIRQGKPARPLYPHPIPQASYRCENGHIDETHETTDARAAQAHEWWDPTGQSVWYVHHGLGIERLTLGSDTPELLWPSPTLSHAHANAAGTRLVADNLPPDNPSSHKVLFYNIEARRELPIVSRLPQLPRHLQGYHLHCHPQFCLDDQLICYTTMVRGEADVAFTLVEDLEAMTAHP
jgi:hypothetical protein